MAVFRGSGTTFYRGDAASPEVFTAVGDVVSIDGPNISKDDIDITALDSTSKEYMGALDDAGDISMVLNWNPADTTHVSLRSDAEGNSQVNYRIIWSDASPGTQLDFGGEVMEFSITTEANDAVKANVRIKISGAKVWS